jgi:glycosyltransferase involved in cell wall biosynthesis
VKIGVDLSCLSESWGGMQRYAFEFTRRLRIASQCTVVPIYFSDADDRVTGRLTEGTGPRFSGVSSRVFREQVVVPFEAASCGRLLVPAYLGPVQSPVPVDLVVYDFLYLRSDAGHSGAQSLYWEKLHEHCLRSADGLFPISRTTREELIERFPECEDRVGPVLYPGGPTGLRSGRVSDTDRPFLLTVGTVSPRKNIDRLIDWYRSSSFHERGIEMRVAGQHGWGDPKPDTLRNAGPGVTWEKRVSEQRLNELYASAECLVLPSAGEGFGLPILEAFYHRLPVVLSDIDVFREVAGPAAWYLPEDPSDWSRVIEEALRDSVERRRRVVKGIRRLRDFRWSRSVARYLEFVREEERSSS